jgi:hypothetical protein
MIKQKVIQAGIAIIILVKQYLIKICNCHFNEKMLILLILTKKPSQKLRRFRKIKIINEYTNNQDFALLLFRLESNELR